MSKEWFSAAELAGLVGLPKYKRGVNQVAARENWETRTNKVRGGVAHEYHLSSLPVETQTVLVKKSVPETIPVKVDRQANQFTYDKQELWTHFDSKPQKQKDEAQRRLIILLQIMALVETGGMTLTNAMQSVADQNAVSWATIKGWYHGTSNKPGVKYYDRTDWLAALVPGFVGRTAIADIDEQAWEFFKADYLRLEKPTSSACYGRLERAAAEYGWTIPSIKTIERRINDIPHTIRVLKREGEAGLRSLYPAQKRTVKELHALEWINGDGYQHNVFVLWPNNEIDRPKTWFWQDVYSRKILAYRVDMTENTDQIRLSFGDLVEEYGIPQHATIDNTRAAANKWMTGGVRNRYRFKIKEDDPIGLLPALGVQIHWTSVHNGRGHGQAKPIERSFGVGGIGEVVDKHPAFAGAYTGKNPTAKPENYGKKAVPIEKFLDVLQQEITAWNARTGRRTEMADGDKSFDQVFNDSYANAPITKATHEQRRMWMLSAEAIKVQRDGTFSLDAGSAHSKKNRYHSEHLLDYAGNKVVVRFDPESLHESVYVYTLDGRYISIANCIEATGFGNTEAARSFKKQRQRFMKAHKIAAKAELAMDEMTVADRMPRLETTEVVDPKIVRVLRPEPKLGRPVPQPQLTEEQKQDMQQFQAQFSEQENTVKAIREDDSRTRFQRWLNLDARLHEGQQLSAADQKFWAMYQKGDEYRFMKDFIADFEDFDLTIEA